MRLSDTIQRVIDLSGAVRDYWDAELPKRHPTYPIVDPDADPGPPPPEEAELEQLLRSLPPDAVNKIMAVMRLRREEFAATELPQRYRRLNAADPKAQQAVSQLLGSASLADQLADGMAALEARGVDVDGPGFAAA